MKKFLLSLTFICGIIGSGIAQDNNLLQGVWKLHKSKNQVGTEQEVPPVFYKFYQLDGSFSNLQLRQNGLTPSHKGIFNLDTSTDSYIEEVKESQNTLSGPVTAKNKLKLTFTEDKKSFTVQGTIQVNNGTFELYEIWTKID